MNRTISITVALVMVLGMLVVAAKLQAADPPPTASPDVATIQPADPTATAQTALLEAVGSFMAGSLYQTYLTVGLLADGRDEGLYEDKQALDILATVDALLATHTKKLQALGKLEAIGPQERKTLSRLADLTDLLARQSRQLQAYWKTDKQQDADKYEATRQEAWKAISDLLGLDK